MEYEEKAKSLERKGEMGVCCPLGNKDVEAILLMVKTLIGFKNSFDAW